MNFHGEKCVSGVNHSVLCDIYLASEVLHLLECDGCCRCRGILQTLKYLLESFSSVPKSSRCRSSAVDV